ncbi:MAG: hypothetical protein J1F12_00410 [Muribaculaceae bacterium]|nr:hypothetical protein [Muribaculaceae bacterium]
MNPWLGLASYTEEALKNNYHFYGRSKAIERLVRLIENNLVVTLYGRSGIGKSSLLQAGVFPVLKTREFFPIIIRFDNVPTEISLAEELWKFLKDNLEKNGIKYKNPGSKYNPDFSDVMVLRKLFASGIFYKKDNKTEITPVIVFDQFEETLYNNSEKTGIFLEQLYALINDNVDFKVSNPDWPDYTNFRIVFSIREDDLFLLEDLIETLGLEDFRENRYRLLPLTKDEAKEIILSPDPDIFNENEKEDIANEIISITSTGVNGQINTLMLSLLCFLLYENTYHNGRKITIEDVRKHRENLIESYYLKTVEPLPKQQREYLEDNLVDSQGRRKSVYFTDLEKNAPKALDLAKNNNQRLLNINQDRVELIHDQLAATVSKIGNQRKSNKTRQSLIVSLLIILFLLLIGSFSTIPENRYNSKVLQNLEKVENHEEVTEITFTKDFSGSVYINDCPELKTINIEKRNGFYDILNCPNLVNLNYPHDFTGKIFVYNCPNINPNKIINERNFPGSDTIYWLAHKSEFPLLPQQQFLDQLYQNNYIKWMNDTVLHIKHLPWIKVYYGESKITLGIPDSVKNHTHLYVPFGLKERFSKFKEFQPYKSINELPVYKTWNFNWVGMMSYFSYNKGLGWIVIGALICVLIFFFVSSVSWVNISQNNNNNKSKFKRFGIIILYTLGMTGVGILSFMSFYWFSYNVVFPKNQAIAIIAGVVAFIIVFILIYKNTYYSLLQYIKANSVRQLYSEGVSHFSGLGKEIFIFIKNNFFSILAIALASALIWLGLFLYFKGYREREKNIQDALQYGYNNQKEKYTGILEALEKKRSPLYSSFNHSLDKLREEASEDSSYLISRFDKFYIENLAAKNNISLELNEIEPIEVSNDGSKLLLRAKMNGPANKNYYQIFLFDILNQNVDSVTSKSEYFYDMGAKFSPSGKRVVSYNKNNKFVFDTEKNKLFNNFLNLPVIPENIIVENDSVFYLIGWYHPYQGKIHNNEIKLLDTPSTFRRNIHLIKNGILAGNDYDSHIIVFDANADSLIFKSEQDNLGYFLTIEGDKAITSKGILDMKNGNLEEKSLSLFHYLYKGKPIKTFDTFSGLKLNDINDSTILILPIYAIKANGSTQILNDKVIVRKEYDNFAVYYLNAVEKPNWQLTEQDKKMFNLK